MVDIEVEETVFSEVVVVDIEEPVVVDIEVGETAMADTVELVVEECILSGTVDAIYSFEMIQWKTSLTFYRL